MAMREIVDRVYARLRGAQFTVDSNVRYRDLLAQALFRLGTLLRGYLKLRRGVFVGSATQITGRRFLTTGRAVVIGPRAVLLALSHQGISLGDHVTIDAGAIIRASGTIRSLGQGVSIGPRTAVGAYDMILGAGGLTIGADCLLGPHVTILSEEHSYSVPERPIREQGEVARPTIIENNVWVGAGACILGGSFLGEGSIVAAGAVVKGHFPAGTIVAGVPARVVRRRW